MSCIDNIYVELCTIVFNFHYSYPECYIIHSFYLRINTLLIIYLLTYLALQDIYKSVVVGKLLYAAPAW